MSRVVIDVTTEVAKSTRDCDLGKTYSWKNRTSTRISKSEQDRWCHVRKGKAPRGADYS